MASNAFSNPLIDNLTFDAPHINDVSPSGTGVKNGPRLVILEDTAGSHPDASHSDIQNERSRSSSSPVIVSSFYERHDDLSESHYDNLDLDSSEKIWRYRGRQKPPRPWCILIVVQSAIIAILTISLIIVATSLSSGVTPTVLPSITTTTPTVATSLSSGVTSTVLPNITTTTPTEEETTVSTDTVTTSTEEISVTTISISSTTTFPGPSDSTTETSTFTEETTPANNTTLNND